jgi:uncharacterized protein YkwD
MGVVLLSRISAAAPIVAILVSFFAAGSPPQDNPAMAAFIEARIYELLNSERVSRGLNAIELSMDLSELARAHSRDMARMGSISHLSSSGKALGGRLLDAGFFYGMGGENVAFSETFVSDFIHKALMDSPEHKGEILRPEYDRVGIGVAYEPDKGYYLTQDFVQSIVPLSAGEAEADLKRRINEARAAGGLDPLVFVPEADKVARYYSEKKAGLATPPPAAKLLGEVAINFVTAGTLDLDAIKLSAVRSPAFEEAGLGVWFGRDPAHLGGAYFITLVLVKTSLYRRMKQDDLRPAFLAALNQPRLRAGLPPLELHSGLSKSADKMSLEIMRGTPRPPAAASLLARQAKIPTSIRSYITEDPSLVPPQIEAEVIKIRDRKIGLGIARGTSDKFPGGAYWVTIIFYY